MIIISIQLTSLNTLFYLALTYIPGSAYDRRKGWDTSQAINVIVWRGQYGNNVHCTTNLNMDTWETSKS